MLLWIIYLILSSGILDGKAGLEKYTPQFLDGIYDGSGRRFSQTYDQALNKLRYWVMKFLLTLKHISFCVFLFIWVAYVKTDISIALRIGAG